MRWQRKSAGDRVGLIKPALSVCGRQRGGRQQSMLGGRAAVADVREAVIATLGSAGPCNGSNLSPHPHCKLPPLYLPETPITSRTSQSAAGWHTCRRRLCLSSRGSSHHPVRLSSAPSYITAPAYPNTVLCTNLRHPTFL